MDIQVSSNFERLLFDAYGRDASAVRALMGALKQAGEFSIAPPALAAIRRDFDAERVDEKACADEMARVYRDSGIVVDPHSAVGVRAARAALERDPATPVISLATAHPAKFPEAVERADRPPSRIAAPSRRDRIAPRALRRAAQRSGGGGEIRPRAGEGRGVSVRLTTLPSGLRVVTDASGDLRTASLGVFVAAGSRHESEGEHGLSHLLEHMAFKGTARRNARAIAETIENVGGDLNAETGVEQTAYFARVLGEDVDLALDVIADILTDSRFDPEELAREKNVILQEIGSVEDAPDDFVFDLFTAAAWPRQPIGRPILGTPRERRRLRPRGDRRLSAPPLSGRRGDRRRGGRGRPRPDRRARRIAAGAARRGESRTAGAGRLSRRRSRS